jgi:hypothetical protein
VLVVEEYWEADIGRMHRSVFARRNAARRWARRAPSPKETVTPWDGNPDDGGRQREGENGAQVSRATNTMVSRGDLTRTPQGLRDNDTVSGALGFTPAAP